MNQIIWTDVTSLAVTLFFIMDPIGNIPVFQSILKEYPARMKVRIIARELLIALGILLIFLLMGVRILSFLGLAQPSLNIAGGILLFLIALKMVFPVTTITVEENEPDPFIVPLAMPLIAGPSAIAILILQATSEPERMLEWTLSLFLAWLLTTTILIFSPLLLNFFGQRGIRALERLMGMLLIMISVQMFLDGLSSYLKNNL